MTEIKPVAMEKHEFEYRDEPLSLFEFSYTYDSNARIKIKDFLIECSSTEIRLSIRTLMEIEAAVSEKSYKS